MSLVFALQLTACAYMTGVIWKTQLVHYPTFSFVDRARFAEFERFHQSRTTWVVAIPMLLEAATAILLVLGRPSAMSQSTAWANLFALSLIWLTTFGSSVPCHTRLEQGFDEATARKLIAGNWLRTGLWTARLVGLALVSLGG